MNQKARTRKALLAAATELIKEGKPPSMPDVAERALVSTATAYRYFPNAQNLWEEASIVLEELLSWSVEIADAGGDDPVARIEAVVRSLGWRMLEAEMTYRILARASLERWFEQAALPEYQRTPVREGRRMGFNAAAVAPLRGRLSDGAVERVINALALAWGPEAVIALRDACRLDTDAAKQVMLDASRWIIHGALAELGPRRRVDASARVGNQNAVAERDERAT